LRAFSPAANRRTIAAMFRLTVTMRQLHSRAMRTACAAVAVAAVVMTGASACRAAPAADERAITVFAAISLTEPLQTLAARFQAQTGTIVRLNLAGSNTLATQI